MFSVEKGRHLACFDRNTKKGSGQKNKQPGEKRKIIGGGKTRAGDSKREKQAALGQKFRIIQREQTGEPKKAVFHAPSEDEEQNASHKARPNGNTVQKPPEQPEQNHADAQQMKHPEHDGVVRQGDGGTLGHDHAEPKALHPTL